MLETAQSIAELDTLAGFADVAAHSNYVLPELTEDTALDIVDGRHPVVETSQHQERFVPNDCILERE